MERLKVWLAEGLILVPTVLLLGFLLFTLSFNLGRLSNVAELLPKETQALVMLNHEDYLLSGITVKDTGLFEWYGQSVENLSWFGEDLGVAWIAGEKIQILEVRSEKDLELSIQGLFPEGELRVSALDEDIRCFEQEALCYRVEGDLAFLAPSDRGLALIASTETLEEHPSYQNLRSRLGHLESAFVFVNLQEMQGQIEAKLSENGVRSPLFLGALWNVFPSWGATIRMTKDGWYAESFTAVNKELLGAAYFTSEEPYKQNFLSWTEPFGWEWGIQDLAAQMVRMEEIFAEISGTGALIFESTLNAEVETLFGSQEWDTLLPLLDGESYLGWTSQDDFLLILEMEDTADRQLAHTLEEAWVKHFNYLKTYTENGEEKAEQIPLTQLSYAGEEVELRQYMAGEEEVAALALTEDSLIVAASLEELRTVLNRKTGVEQARNESDFSVLLPGTQEIWIFNSAFLSEEHILKSTLSTFTQLVSTRKIFADGIFTRTSLLP